MPQLQFQGIAESLQRLPQVLQTIPDILRDPSANPLQAAILLGIALVFMLIVLVGVVLLIMGRSDEGEELFDDEYGEIVESIKTERVVVPKRPLAWLTTLSAAVIFVAFVWIVTGVTTSSSQACSSCHASTVHAAARADDPHASVPCVSCHESGGVVARATIDLATRAQHLFLAQTNPAQATGYGKPVASDACMRCHGSQISATVTDAKLGVRVSHKEPLAAGAQCTDCHALNSGVVNATTVGMPPCLRCHNGTTAKAECVTCHVSDPSSAIRASVAAGGMASALVPNPQCNGCHTDMTKCKACHGIAMPHTREFKAFGHARDGAIDVWNNGGKTCARCHYPGHNDCQQNGCHVGPFPSHPPVWRTMHGLTSWSGAQTACSCHQWNPLDHDGLTFCEICHAQKPANAKP